MIEAAFLARLRTLPLHPGAHGLTDDTATLGRYTLTTDTLVEGIHYLPTDPPQDVAWKLVATNLSDLAAKGALVEGVLLNLPLTDAAWDGAFLDGLAAVLAAFDCPILGGDTVSLPPGAPRVLTCTAIGRDAPAPPRSGVRAGDGLWVTGTIGDAGVGLAIAKGKEMQSPSPLGEGLGWGLSASAGLGETSPTPSPSPKGEGRNSPLLTRYRRPTPRLAEGRALAPSVHAMMDVSDGLLLDAARMAAASDLAVTIDLALVPLSAALVALTGDDRATRLAAATAGDDYELLFATDAAPAVAATRVGTFAPGNGLTLTHAGAPVPLPASLGFQHGLR